MPVDDRWDLIWLLKGSLKGLNNIVKYNYTNNVNSIINQDKGEY
jgi:hypothetical protein